MCSIISLTEMTVKGVTQVLRWGECAMKPGDKRDLARSIFYRLNEKNQIAFLERLARLAAEQALDPAAPASADRTTA